MRLGQGMLLTIPYEALRLPEVDNTDTIWRSIIIHDQMVGGVLVGTLMSLKAVSHCRYVHFAHCPHI